MKAIAIAVLILSGSSLFAQTAKVIPLKPEDTKELQATYNALQEAQKKWDAVRNKVQKEYTTVKPDDPDAGNTIVSGTVSSDDCDTIDIPNTGHLQIEGTYLNGNCIKNGKPVEQHVVEGVTYRRGWENGIEFDKDFKFIVPKPPAINFNQGQPDWIMPTVQPGGIFVTPGSYLSPCYWGAPNCQCTASTLYSCWPIPGTPQMTPYMTICSTSGLTCPTGVLD